MDMIWYIVYIIPTWPHGFVLTSTTDCGPWRKVDPVDPVDPMDPDPPRPVATALGG